MNDANTEKGVVRKIQIMTTGGTIGSMKEDGTTVVREEGEALSAYMRSLETLKESIYEEWNITIEFSFRDLFNKDSSDVNPSDWIKIIDAIVEDYDKYNSFVITHGTNTLGYTCSALSFALGNLGKPVILTGSQVPHLSPGSDASLNLENAIRIAVYPNIGLGAKTESVFNGVYAVFGSNVIAGPRVKKVTEFDYDAFKTFNAGNVGRIGRVIRINWDNLEKYQSKLKPFAEDAFDLDVVKDFDINIVSLTEFPGLNPEIFETLVERGTKGFVLRSFGGGDPSIKLLKAFDYLRENKIPIVVTTQAPDGVATMKVNDPGVKAEKKGAIPANDMSIESMSVKMAWLIGQEQSYQKIKRNMTNNIIGEVSDEKLD